jgi:hypothetical protein
MNPLNEIPFDINTLIPYTEFNWDTVQGIDDIHKDVENVWKRYVTTRAKDIAKIEEHTNNVDAQILDQSQQALQTINNTLDAVDSRIISHNEAMISPLAAVYGLPAQELQWWVVFRQIKCGEYHPFLEQWAITPTGKEAYGPYEYPCALARAFVTTLPNLLEHGLYRPPMIPNDGTWKFAVDEMYNKLIADPGVLEREKGGYVDCGLDVWTASKIEASCPTESPIESPATSSPVFAVPQPGEILDALHPLSCEEFLASSWHVSQRYQSGARQVSIYTNETGNNLNDDQYEAMKIRCLSYQPKFPVDPLPVIPKQPITTLPIPPVSQLPVTIPSQPSSTVICPPQQKVDPVTINVLPCDSKTITTKDGIVGDSKGLEKCCEALIQIGSDLVKAVNDLRQTTIDIDEADATCEEYGDEAFDISSCAKQEWHDFVDREQIPLPDDMKRWLGKDWINHIQLRTKEAVPFNFDAKDK